MLYFAIFSLWMFNIGLSVSRVLFLLHNTSEYFCEIANWFTNIDCVGAAAVVVSRAVQWLW